ncbi:uncharacterized protein LOC129222465 [Uloborus diversus]|uniref:uncharacterized protein LOC129222465 n=1 Tax=Uloborus diversus TaxID=327109 RepID=UPI00240A005C|nr:uncharacterized protein LOC129222465 [Uloborus diversus]
MGEPKVTSTYGTTAFRLHDFIWDNETSGIQPDQSRQKENAFLLGISFVGGFVLGVVIHLVYHFFVRWILTRHLPAAPDTELSNGVCNLAFIGDDWRPPGDDPPSYSTVVQSEDNAMTFWSRFFKREKNTNDPQEEPPPSYSNAVEELRRDRRTSSF